MGLFRSKLGKLFKWAIYLVAILFAIVYLADLASGHKVQQWVIKEKIGSQFAISNGGDGTTLLVKPSALPQTQSDRMSSSAADLLPHEWESDPLQTGSGAAPVVSAAEQRSLVSASTHFLTAWETFRPWNDATYAAWKKKVSPYVDSTNYGDVIDRVDSYQPQTICPQAACPTGSTFLGIDPLSFTLRSDDGQDAYVTVNGYVRYQAVLGGEKQGAVRQYALLFSKVAGQWQVTRAAAETIAAS